MIEVRDVTKRFGATVALDGVSFRLDKGEILGFLGPNGAGKSTAMKIVTTFLAPDGGTVSVDGIDVLRNPLEVRSRIGYLPENHPLYVDMMVHEYLQFVGRARGLAGDELRRRLEWVVEACGLGSVFRKPINELSKGFRQRTGLAQALIHDPEVLILDEPTSGLDPLQIIGIRELIQGLARSKTIIFSTHILQEVSPVTDRVVIINGGRIVADGRIGELERAAMGRNRIFVAYRAPAAEAEAALRGLGGLHEVRPVAGRDGAARFEVRTDFGQDVLAPLGRLGQSRGWDLLELQESPFSLEDTFIALTRQGAAPREVSHV
ncbi:MAG: MFS transporter [Gemmatimonas sp.]|nr:MFS transporter [Gemmatimonas sp.]